MAALPDLLAGVALLPRGLGLMLQRRRLFWLGALPPLITSLLFGVVLVLEIAALDPLVAWLTPFATDWDPGAALALRVVVGIALLAASILLMVVTFAALTLAVGGPLYDKISEAVDRGLPAPPAPMEESAARGLARGLRQSAAVVGVSLAGALAFFAIGLVPVVGQLAAPVAAAVFGGWLLALELTGSAAERRGLLTLRSRRALLRSRRLRVLGFGVPTFLLMAIPVVSIVVFPVATAAATLLIRDLAAGSSVPDPT